MKNLSAHKLNAIGQARADDTDPVELFEFALRRIDGPEQLRLALRELALYGLEVHESTGGERHSDRTWLDFANTVFNAARKLEGA